MTTTQNKKFTTDVLGPYPLDTVIEWIQANLSPDEVFDADHLGEWATAHGWREGL